MMDNQLIELQSTVTSTGTLEVTLASRPMPVPGADEVVIRVEASPINPSDLGMLLAGADMSRASAGQGEFPVLTAPISEGAMKALAARVDMAMPVGNEGAGVVVATGDSEAAEALLGRTVAVLAGGMYASHRCVPAAMCLVLPDGVSPEQGASCFVNPLTALGMVETMREEGHTALVHTAAASNLGQMLQRICTADGVALVNIVRRPEHVEFLSRNGAAHVVDSSAPTFADDLTKALSETGATIAFDAVGGGDLASTILGSMERAASTGGYNRYGSDTFKQVYVYGGLNRGPTVLDRSYGMTWAVGGWLLPPFLAKIGMERTEGLRQRVASEITTTFASNYTSTISLTDVTDVRAAAGYSVMATGEKYLVAPNL